MCLYMYPMCLYFYLMCLYRTACALLPVIPPGGQHASIISHPPLLCPPIQGLSATHLYSACPSCLPRVIEKLIELNAELMDCLNSATAKQQQQQQQACTSISIPSLNGGPACSAQPPLPQQPGYIHHSISDSFMPSSYPPPGNYSPMDNRASGGGPKPQPPPSIASALGQQQRQQPTGTSVSTTVHPFAALPSAASAHPHLAPPSGTTAQAGPRNGMFGAAAVPGMAAAASAPPQPSLTDAFEAFLKSGDTPVRATAVSLAQPPAPSMQRRLNGDGGGVTGAGHHHVEAASSSAPHGRAGGFRGAGSGCMGALRCVTGSDRVAGGTGGGRGVGLPV